MQGDPSIEKTRTAGPLDNEASNPTASQDETLSHDQRTRPIDNTQDRELPTHERYQITREIARGGMGKVLAAYEKSLDRKVAIKTLLPGADTARFETEAKITAKLPHPNIPPVYALGRLDNDAPFFGDETRLVVKRLIQN